MDDGVPSAVGLGDLLLLVVVWADLKILENFLFPSLRDHDVFYGYATTFF